jgi:hypothetical protein
VADKSTSLVLTALSRAAAAAQPIAVHGTRKAPGLFPATAAGKKAAQQCLDEGLLSATPEQPAQPDMAGGAVTATKKQAGAVCTITDKGLAYLLAQLSPQQVLEQFVQELGQRRQVLAEWAAAAQRLHAANDTLQAHVAAVLARFPSPERAAGAAGGLKALFREFLADSLPVPAPSPGERQPTERALEGRLLGQLQKWRASDAPEDCPLPQLYRQAAGDPPVTIGQFHDALRRLHERSQIYLHPWTGPLYEIPEPPFALMVGHEIAYYASLRGTEPG